MASSLAAPFFIRVCRGSKLLCPLSASSLNSGVTAFRRPCSSTNSGQSAVTSNTHNSGDQDHPAIVKRKAKEIRFERNLLLRRNRHDPQMEKLARTGKLFIPLPDVQSEWHHYRGRDHLQTIGHHLNIFLHVFGCSFRPLGFMGVTYPGEHNVHYGNILTAEQTSSEPTVTLPHKLHSSDGYSTLILSNPDGHLNDSSKELLHWAVANIPGGRFSDGVTVCPYLPPVPPKGTGFHRYVFSLYTHPQPLNTNLLLETNDSSSGGSWLDQRSFSTTRLLSTHPEIKPFTFALFQCQWDTSVHDTYMNTLVYPEPVYSIEKPTPARRLKTREIRRKRSNRYRNM